MRSRCRIFIRGFIYPTPYLTVYVSENDCRLNVMEKGQKMKTLKELLTGILCGLAAYITGSFLFYLAYTDRKEPLLTVVIIAAFLIGIAAVILPIAIKSGSVRSVLTKSLSVFVTYIMAFAVSISSGLSAYVFRLFLDDKSSSGSDGASGIILIVYQLVLFICYLSIFIPMLAVCSDKEKAAGNQF